MIMSGQEFYPMFSLGFFAFVEAEARESKNASKEVQKDEA